MENIIWEWRFPNHWKTNSDTWVEETILAIDQWEYWDHVKVIPLDQVNEDIVLWTMSEFESKVQLIISDIVEESIQNYLSYKAENDELSDKWIDYEKRNLVQETEWVIKEMNIEIMAIQDTLDYLENMWKLDEVDIYEVIKEVLRKYGDKVFSILVQNQDKIKQKLLAPKRLRRRKNAKKKKKGN